MKHAIFEHELRGRRDHRPAVEYASGIRPHAGDAAAAQGIKHRSPCGATSLIECYVSFGGVVTGDELTAMLRSYCDQPISRLARWMVSRRLVSFREASQVYMPLFQFDPKTLSLCGAVSDAVAELSGVMNDRAIATWFVTPTSDGVSPAELAWTEASALADSARITSEMIRRGRR